MREPSWTSGYLADGFMGELFKTYSYVTDDQRKDFSTEFGERLANSLLRAGCRTRADVILLAFWHSKEFAMCPHVGKVQVKRLVDWFATQPEFDIVLEKIMNGIV